MTKYFFRNKGMKEAAALRILIQMERIRLDEVLWLSAALNKMPLNDENE